jgi:hypothetical protein
MILSARGVKPDMLFSCCDCGEKFTGQQVIDDQVELTIVSVNKAEPIKSVFRCECCQDDVEERA